MHFYAYPALWNYTYPYPKDSPFSSVLKVLVIISPNFLKYSSNSLHVTDRSTFLIKTLAFLSIYLKLRIGLSLMGLFKIFSYLHSSKAFFAK